MPRIRPAKFAHIVYRTRQFENMIKWYETVFDAKVQFQNPVLGFLTYDDEHHRFAFINMAVADPEGGGTSKQGKIGVDHVAYTYNTVRDLAENYAWLKERGILPYWTLHHGVTLSMYYADPDGNQMEFQVDSYPTPEAATAYMNGPGYTHNAIGVEYDPDEMVAKLRAGVPESEFLTRKTDDPMSPIRGSLVDA